MSDSDEIEEGSDGRSEVMLTVSCIAVDKWLVIRCLFYGLDLFIVKYYNKSTLASSLTVAVYSQDQ